jgi:hypothetical protein
MIDELADHGAPGCAHGHGCQEGWCKQIDREAYAASPSSALATKVIAGLVHGDRVVLVWVTRIAPSISIPFSATCCTRASNSLSAASRWG